MIDESDRGGGPAGMWLSTTAGRIDRIEYNQAQAMRKLSETSGSPSYTSFIKISYLGSIASYISFFFFF